MILHLEHGEPTEVLDLREALERTGLRTQAVPLADSGAIVRCVGDTERAAAIVAGHPAVHILDAASPHPLASRYQGQRSSVVAFGGVRPVLVGGHDLVVIAGPCSVESRNQIVETALGVQSAGVSALRGGAFKPRTSPYPFQGLGEEGLALLAEARRATGLPVVTEVMDTRLVQRVAETADVIQIGSRNMQNYPLLDEVGRVQRPVLLKRGLSSTIEELLLAAERIMLRGNDDVILCERGIRTFETATRNTLDVSAIAVLRERTHLPLLVDPSHAAGRRSLVPALALAGIAAGADGLLLEAHACPEQALTDAAQSLSMQELEGLMNRVALVGQALGRGLHNATPRLGDVA